VSTSARQASSVGCVEVEGTPMVTTPESGARVQSLRSRRRSLLLQVSTVDP
jgi:hypothetical protein